MKVRCTHPHLHLLPTDLGCSRDLLSLAQVGNTRDLWGGECARSVATLRENPSALRRDVDLEPFHRQLADRAVLGGGLDCLVELHLQLGVLPAQADADAVALDAARDGGTREGVNLEL